MYDLHSPDRIRQILHGNPSQSKKFLSRKGYSCWKEGKSLENTMRTITKHILDNLATFGLSTEDALIVTKATSAALVNGDEKLILSVGRTLGDKKFGLTFKNLIKPGVKGERKVTQITLECATRAADPTVEFYWNDARKFRDKVYDALAGANKGGLTIIRYDWSQDPKVADGEIYFEIDPEGSSPIEDEIEDRDDQANKSIFLTYNVHWWRKI
jgi:hypothetical protein